MTPQQQAFLPPFCKACLEWEAQSTFPYKRQITIVSVAQGALETGWGTSSLAKPPINNFGGIKWHLPQWPAYSAETREVISGKSQEQEGAFQTYPAIADYVVDHAAVLLRWTCVKTAAGISIEALCESLGPWTSSDRTLSIMDQRQHSNYSTDPNYPATLMEIIEGSRLDGAGVIEQFAAQGG